MNYQPKRPPDRRPMSEANKLLIVISLVAIFGFGAFTVFTSGNNRRQAATPTPTPGPTLPPQQISTVEEALQSLTPTPSMPPIVLASAPPTFSPVPNFEMTPSPTDVPTLKVGSMGEVVKKMQGRLIELGYMRAESDDGNFGKGTQNAVREFQRVNGLGTDGAAGPKTLTLLFSDQAKAKPAE